MIIRLVGGPDDGKVFMQAAPAPERILVPLPAGPLDLSEPPAQMAARFVAGVYLKVSTGFDVSGTAEARFEWQKQADAPTGPRASPSTAELVVLTRRMFDHPDL